MKKVYRRKDTPVANQGTGPTHLAMPAIEGIGEDEEQEEEAEEEEQVEEEEQEEEEHEVKTTESGTRHDPLFTTPAPLNASSFSEEKPRIVSPSGFHDDKDDRIVTCAESEIYRKAADGDSGTADETVRAQPDDKRRGVLGDGMLRSLSGGSGECCSGGEGGSGGGVDGGLVKRFSSSVSVSTEHSRLSEDMMALELNKAFTCKTKLEEVAPLQTISSHLQLQPDQGRDKDAQSEQILAREETYDVGKEPGQQVSLEERVFPVQSQADELSSSAGSKTTSAPEKRSSEGKCGQAAVEEQDLRGIKLGQASLNTCHASLICQPGSSSPSICQPVHKNVRPTQESPGYTGQPLSPGPSGGIKEPQTTKPPSGDGGHYGGVRPKTTRVLHRKNTPALLPKIEKLYATRTMLSSDGILSEEPVEDEE